MRINIKCKGVYAYADDIACLCQNISDTKRVIKCIEEWALRNKMQINKNKSGIIFLNTK